MKTSMILGAVALALVMMPSVACANDAASTPAAQAAPDQMPGSAAALSATDAAAEQGNERAAAAANAGFVTLDRAGARALVDPGTHARPTVLALWSLECVHCKKNLALFGQLAKSHGGFEVLTLAVEPPAAGLAEVLERFEVPGARYAYGSDMPEALAYAIDPNWRGELPRTLFFDGRGGVVAVSGVVGEADVLARLGLAAAVQASR